MAHAHPLFSQVLQRPRIYLANHSLGRPLDRTAEDVAEALHLWYAQLGDAWDAWLAEIERFRTATARLVGASRADCIVPKTSAGQGLRAVLNSHDDRIDVLTTRGEFDSVDFLLKHYRDRGRITLTFVEPDGEGLFRSEDIICALNSLSPAGERVGVRGQRTGQTLLVLSQVMFATGQVLPDLPAIIQTARARGTPVLLDVLPRRRRPAARPHRPRRGFRHRRQLQVPARRPRRLLAVRATAPPRARPDNAGHRLVRQARSLRLRPQRTAPVRPRRRCLARIHAAGAVGLPGPCGAGIHARHRGGTAARLFAGAPAAARRRTGGSGRRRHGWRSVPRCLRGGASPAGCSAGSEAQGCRDRHGCARRSSAPLS